MIIVGLREQGEAGSSHGIRVIGRLLGGVEPLVLCGRGVATHWGARVGGRLGGVACRRAALVWRVVTPLLWGVGWALRGVSWVLRGIGPSLLVAWVIRGVRAAPL